jgi:hypothetical protein
MNIAIANCRSFGVSPPDARPMRISYKPDGFSGADPRLQPGERTLTFTRAALLRSVATVGRRNVTDVLQHGDLSWYEYTWRTAMLLANVQERPDNSLEWSPAYGGLDPSERVRSPTL